MAGSNSSISSNENEVTTKPIAAGRGYNLEAPSNAPAPMPMVAPTDGGQSSRSQTPPPPNVLQSDTNPPTTNSPAAASKNALGITHGWGVGLAHSGSYLATNVRTTSTIPLLVEDPETYDEIKNILRKKQARERSQLEMRAKQQAAKKRQLPTAEDQEKITEKRKIAVMQVAQGKEKLQQLLSERDELKKSIRSEWDAKIDKFKQEALLREAEAVNALKLKHAEEMKQFIQNVEAQDKADDDELAMKLSELDDEKKGRAEGGQSEAAPEHPEINVSPIPKKQKLDEPLEEKHMTDTKDPSDLYDDLFESSAKPTHKEEESDQELFGDSDDEAEKSPEGQKKDELKKINDDLNDLNAVKSQMVWLLKQVITAETKLKMKQKMQAKS